MKSLPKKLQQKLDERTVSNALRQLGVQNDLIDFSSNDYLGFSSNKEIFNASHNALLDLDITQNGATGSRLLSGNHKLYETTEKMLSKFHNSDSALIFNSGYDANLGFFSAVPQRGDLILFDEYIHASIRDGITMSNAKSYKFKHNDLDDLKAIVKRIQSEGEVYIVTESVFSMDGDSPYLEAFAKYCNKNNYQLIVDEAHAVGVFGKNGSGLVQELGVENQIFARITTFGKAMGCHGAVVLGSNVLKQYLINFSRSFIYTTALPPHSLATILSAYGELSKTSSIEKLHQNIVFFKAEVERLKLQHLFINSDSAIQCCVILGNEIVKSIANQLHDHNFNVKAILAPTVPKGQERLRFCLHSYNSEKEISTVLTLLSTFVK